MNPRVPIPLLKFQTSNFLCEVTKFLFQENSKQTKHLVFPYKFNVCKGSPCFQLLFLSSHCASFPLSFFSFAVLIQKVPTVRKLSWWWRTHRICEEKGNGLCRNYPCLIPITILCFYKTFVIQHFKQQNQGSRNNYAWTLCPPVGIWGGTNLLEDINVKLVGVSIIVE